VLGLGFPGGPAIEKAAREAGAKPPRLPRAWLGDSADFSFSGLKTAVARVAAENGVLADQSTDSVLQREPGGAPQVQSQSAPRLSVPDIAAGFQTAVVDVLTKKTLRAAEAVNARSVLLSGGVAANGPLRASLREASSVPVFVPPPVLCTDNGAMIAAAAHFRAEAGAAALDLDVRASWPIA